MSPLADARHRFRAARHRLARAVVDADHRATVAAARHLLAAHDDVTTILVHPDDRRQREVRALQRWRRFALGALRFDPPPAGLLDRARVLVEITDTMRNHDDQ
ncbi:MAG: hypothetical protein ACREPV_13815 [Lysobacter sp.]